MLVGNWNHTIKNAKLGLFWDETDIRRKCKEGTERLKDAYLQAGYILKPEEHSIDPIETIFESQILTPITMLDVARAVCDKHEITQGLLRGRGRNKQAVEAREEFCKLAYHRLGKSTTMIAKFLGDRDHTTVVHYLHRSPAPKRPLPTHCGYGHEWTPENTYSYTYRGMTRRSCRACRAKWHSAAKARRRLNRCRPID